MDEETGKIVDRSLAKWEPEDYGHHIKLRGFSRAKILGSRIDDGAQSTAPGLAGPETWNDGVASAQEDYHMFGQTLLRYACLWPGELGEAMMGKFGFGPDLFLRDDPDWKKIKKQNIPLPDELYDPNAFFADRNAVKSSRYRTEGDALARNKV